jgi:hypothetical protein
MRWVHATAAAAAAKSGTQPHLDHLLHDLLNWHLLLDLQQTAVVENITTSAYRPKLGHVDVLLFSSMQVCAAVGSADLVCQQLHT